jgi:serine/threonine protein kinase
LLTGETPFKLRGASDLSKILYQKIRFELIENELARDFVERLLQRSVKLRISIDDVIKHEFMGKFREN